MDTSEMARSSGVIAMAGKNGVRHKRLQNANTLVRHDYLPSKTDSARCLTT